MTDVIMVIKFQMCYNHPGENMKKISKLVALALTLVFLLLMYMVYNLNLIPIKYFLIGGGVLALIVLALDFKLIRKKTHFGSRLFFTIVSMLVIAITVYGMTYINATKNFMSGILAKNFETVTYDVVVNSNGSYNNIHDLYEKNIGYNSNDKYYSLVKFQIRKDVKYNPKEYKAVDDFESAIINGDIDSVVLSDNRYTMIKEENTEFANNTKVIKQYKVIVKREKKKKTSTKSTTKDAFALYISGIDTYGAISSVSRSDVNILAIVNPKTEKILLVSIPRDYYVQLHGTTGSKDKLTHAGIYGIDMSMNTIGDLLDTNVDYYIRLNFSTLTKSIDLVDGIDVYSDTTFTPWTNKGITITEGVNHMDGSTALAFARERHAYTTGDRHRGENQQAIITAMIKKMTSGKYVTKYKKILSSLEGTFETSMSYDEITDLFKLQIDKNIDWDITSISLDGSGSYGSTYSMGSRQLYVMIPNQSTVNSAKEQINEYLGEK